MGNNSSKEEITHPKFVGKIPNPWDLSRILPELIVFRQNKQKVIIQYDTEEEVAINSLFSADLLPTNRIILITHGFRTTKEKEWLTTMKDKMIAERDQTVAIVGWGEGSDIGVLNYTQASANALAVGKWLSKYAIEVRKRCEDIYIWGIGHSLGAHLMGTAGRESNAFDRVTGLDPAGVGFQVENEDKRLNKNDAKLVDVIHSDGKSVPYFGTLLPLGSIDFYPNYGWNQPTYDEPPKKPYMIESEAQPKGDVSPYGDGFTTSHTRAIDYFIWSIDHFGKFKTNLVLEANPTVEKAVHRIRCASSTRQMGYYADTFHDDENEANFHRCYYVATNAREPWL